MDQSNQLQLTLLYFIQQERLNDLFNNEEISILGLYGTLESISIYLEDRIGQKVQATEELLNKSKRGLIAFAKYQKDFFLVYLGPEQYFLDKFEESTEITLYRYLKDLCQKIVLLPSKKIIQEWKHIDRHFYQEQESIVQEFEIQKIDDQKLDHDQFMFEFKKAHLVILQNLKNGQGNQRIANYKNIQSKKINKDTIRNYIQSIIRNNLFDLNQINLDQYNLQYQKFIRERLEKFQKSFNQQMQQLSSDLLKVIQGYCINLFRSELKKKSGIFNQIHDIIFKSFRDNLGLNQIRDLEQSKLKDILKQNIKDQSLIEHEEDLPSILLEYKTEFKKMYDNKYQIQHLINDILKDTELLPYQANQEFSLVLILYEFKVITTQKQDDQFATIDQIIYQDLDIRGLKNIQTNKLTVEYFFQASDQKQNFMILQKQYKDKLEYILVHSQNYYLQEIFTMQINKSNCLFFYNIYNQTIYIFNSKQGISKLLFNEDRGNIQSEHNVEVQKNFIDICFLAFFETFILLSDEQKLYKWPIQSKEITNINIATTKIKVINRILTSGNGNYYSILNDMYFDIINFNNQVVKSIDLLQCFSLTEIDVKQFQLFCDHQDWYLVYIDEQNQKCFQIKNLSNLQKIVSKKQTSNQTNVTNPFLDLIKGAIIKYGPSNNIFETTPQLTKLYIQQSTYDCLLSYLKLLDIEQSEEIISQQNLKEINGFKLICKQLAFLILTRTTIQICTVNKQNLIPLSNGFQQQFQQQKIRILDKVNKLQFGILEKLLCMEENKNIFIVSIMGRQSSGKSYLLNRIFGTRFGVSSARCTDGIWMSISKIENITFLLLDCEGLFSTRRTMLLAFLSSISDITILNQDLTFSRNLNELFQNLSKSIEQIRGEKLFKGKLMIAVRDVNQKEKDSAQKELMKNVELIKNNQQTGNFLTLLFNYQFQTILMSYFDNKQFDKDILKIRQEFLQNAYNQGRWDNSQQLIRSMKIMLIQIEVKDHRNLEDHELEYTIKNLVHQTTDYWIQMIQEEIPNVNLLDQIDAYEQMLQYSFIKLEYNNNSLEFNIYLRNAEVLIQKLLKQRSDKTLQYLKINLKKDRQKQTFSERIKKSYIEIRQNLSDFSGQFMICFQKCSHCFLQCSFRKDHLERDQVVLKDKLQDEIKQIESQLSSIQSQLKSADNLEQTLMKKEIFEQKSMEVKQIIKIKQMVLDNQQQVNLMEQYLNCIQFQPKDFKQLQQNYFNNYMTKLKLPDNNQNLEWKQFWRI